MITYEKLESYSLDLNHFGTMPGIYSTEKILQNVSEKINEHMKLIYYDQDIQVFNGPKSEPRMTLDIKTLKQLAN